MKRKKKKNPQNRFAIISVTFVVGVLFIALMAKSNSLQDKIAEYEAKSAEVSARIDSENDRTKEIDELKKYMQTDEYAREVARDKLGLVDDNVIVFKEKD